jgi:hypothetical protein
MNTESPQAHENDLKPQSDLNDAEDRPKELHGHPQILQHWSSLQHPTCRALTWNAQSDDRKITITGERYIARRFLASLCMPFARR